MENPSATPLKRVQQLARIEREDIGTIIVFGVGIGLMSLATPVAVQALVNTVTFGALFQPLVVLTLILFVLLSFSNTLAALQFYVVEMMQRRIIVRLFGSAVDRLLKSDASVRNQYYLPELANRFLEAVTLQKTAAVLLLETLGYVLQTVIGMVLLAFYHPMLLALDLFLIGSLLFILFFMGNGGTRSAILQSKKKYILLSWIESLAANPVTGKSTAEREFLLAQSNHIAMEYLAARQEYFRVVFRQNSGGLVLHTMANTLLLAMGGWMVIEQQLSLGQLIAAELVLSAMVYGLIALGKTLDNYYNLIAGMDKVAHVMDLPQETQSGIAPKKPSSAYEVQLHAVSIPPSPVSDVLVKTSYLLPPGGTLALCEGAERGTLLDLLYGARLPSAGYISLDKQDIRDLNLGLLRDTIRLVRDAEPYAASIHDNLCVGRSLDSSSLRQVLAQVGLLETIMAWPEELRKQVCANGTPLTPEQNLRLTLARALLAEPKLLLVDGILDKLDNRYRGQILDCLFAEDAPWTLVVNSQLPEVWSRCRYRVRIVDGEWQEMTTKG